MPDSNNPKNQPNNTTNAKKHTGNVFESNKKYFTISIYTLFVIAIATVIIYTINNPDPTRAMIGKFISTLSPFLIAFFIAYLLHPLVVRLDTFFKKIVFKDKKPRLSVFLSLLISYLFVISVLTIVLVYITPQLRNSIADLINKLPGMYEEIIKYLQDLETSFPNVDFELVENKITELIPQLISYGTNLVSNLFPALLTLSVSIAKLIINIILSIVISCYMLSDRRNLAKMAKRFVYAVLPEKKATSFCQTAKECNTIFSKFIIGKSIDSLIIGIICFILMTILRLPYSILLSVIVGLTNMIPYFGPFIGAVPGILLFLFINPIQSLIFAVMILVLQQFDGLYLGPKILGDSTGLKPLWVIFAITIGGAYFGVIGMFLGVPTVAVISFLLNKFITNRLKEKNIQL